MPKTLITPIDAEIEEEQNRQAGDSDQSADQKVPGSGEIPTEPEGGPQRQPS